MRVWAAQDRRSLSPTCGSSNSAMASMLQQQIGFGGAASSVGLDDKGGIADAGTKQLEAPMH